MIDDVQLVQDVYRSTVEHGRPPRVSELALALGEEPADVIAAFKRLSSRRLLALAPDSGEIVMAPPFSAVPTGFLVTAGGRSYFANCVWDAFGVAAALHADAVVEASCACCGDPMTLVVRDGQPQTEPAIAHFAVPAAQWWDNITYT